jgi:hypothetical protein
VRIAVISDLHIGAEDFRPDGFAAFLDHLEREHDEIILLGDVFECYFPALPWGALADYDRFDRRHADITRRFRAPRYTVLSGNHDMVARRARGVPSRTERGGPGFRVLLSHGHENEPAYRSPLRTRLVELYMWLVYRLKRLGLPALYHYSYRMDYELNVKDGGRAHVRAARDHVRQGYDVVVFGPPGCRCRGCSKAAASSARALRECPWGRRPRRTRRRAPCLRPAAWWCPTPAGTPPGAGPGPARAPLRSPPVSSAPST